MGIGNSIIGALRVNLGLDSAAFTTGLKVSQGELSKFGKIGALSLAGLATAAAGVATALAIATKSAINHADAMSKSAQKAGVTTEALSRLAYAASYSDVSTEDLTASLGKLSKTMADAAQNTKGPAASAFAALGVSVTDSSGKLRGADKVFTDIADRFSHLEDGATKTALSMALFGKSGADLIPFLNGGADDIARLEAESDKLGITLSTKTGKAAEKFNDTLGIIGAIIPGIFNKVAERALPVLQDLAQTLASPKFAEAAAWLSTTILTAFDKIVQAAATVINAIAGISSKIAEAYNYATGPEATRTTAQLKKDIADYQKMLTGPDSNVSDRPGTTQRLSEAQAELANRAKGPADSGSVPSTFDFRGFLDNRDTSALGPIGTGIDLSKFTSGTFGKAAPGMQTDQIKTYNDQMAQLRDTLTQVNDPFGDLQKNMVDLGNLMKWAPDQADKFGAAMQRNALDSVGYVSDMASGISGALAGLFKDNKAFAASNAVLQGLSGVAYALGGSAPPWNFINAAAVGIEAAANVADILSTNQTTTSMPGGGGLSGATAALPSTGSALNITLRGSGAVNVDDFFSQATQQIADGGLGAFVKVMKAA